MKPVLGFCLCQTQVILMVGDFLSRLPPSPCLQSADLSSVSVITLPRLSGILDFLSSIVISGCPNLLFNRTVQIHSFHSLGALTFLYPRWEGPAKHPGLSVRHVSVPLVRRVPGGRASADSVPPGVDESGEGSSLIRAQLSPRELLLQRVRGFQQSVPCLLLARGRRIQYGSHVAMGVAGEEKGKPRKDLSLKQPRFPSEEKCCVSASEKLVYLVAYLQFVCCLAHTHTHTPQHTFISQGLSKINQTGTWWRGE